MFLAKLIQCRTVTGQLICVNVRITDRAWQRCNADTQSGSESILASEPVQLLAGAGHGNGIKFEGDHFVMHTQTGQRLATGHATFEDLQWSGLTFERVYNH